MYKHLYRRFIQAHPQDLHFACHSHHYWPDVTRAAQIQYWDDSCQFVDDKWNYFFSTKVPQAQKHIAHILNLAHPSQIVFAPNTHEFVFRLLSSLDWTKKIRILTTDSEFYSFDRQINRLAEFGHFEIIKVPSMPLSSFNERFANEMTQGSWDLIFISHVFFNSGYACDIVSLASKAPANSLFVIDGYHSFMALPLNLSQVQHKAFYVAGSYKYAQGGEGACFLYVPPETQHRPVYTGWFAELSHLSSVDGQVGYPSDALQYAGSTLDFSALYRLIAALECFEAEGLDVKSIHAFVQNNQQQFLAFLKNIKHPLINEKNLLMINPQQHGHFLTFNLPSDEITQKIVQELSLKKLKTDSRGNRLRFGFGLYHDANDLKSACDIIATTFDLVETK